MATSRTGSLGVLCVGIAAVALAGDAVEQPEFKSLPARDAASTYQTQIARLNHDYQEKLNSARKVYVSALSVAKERATRAGDLDEAVHIRDEISRLQQDAADDPHPHAGSVAVNPAGGLAAARAALTHELGGSIWTQNGVTFKFNEDGSLTTGDGKPYGRWTVLSPKAAIAQLPGGLTDRFEFDESIHTFNTREFGQGTPTEKMGHRKE